MRSSLAAIALLLVLAGCTTGAMRWMRQHGYPPSFEFLARKEVGSAMRSLALASHGLDQSLREGDRTGLYRRGEIIRFLDAMEATSTSLGAGKWPTDHPMLWSRIGLFYDDVRRARQMAAAEPPSYVLAGSVSGACAYCHSARELGESPPRSRSAADGFSRSPWLDDAVVAAIGMHGRAASRK